MSLEIVVLAAGRGTRMRSDLPKVLHHLAGRPLLSHVLATARDLKPDQIHVVIGFGADRIRATYAHADNDVSWVLQNKQKGTGHAVQQALPGIKDGSNVLVLFGDVPLVSTGLLKKCTAACPDAGVTLRLVTACVSDSTGFGRIVRAEDGSVQRIVEDKDATPDQSSIDEINTGILYAPVSNLARYLDQLDMDNAQGELYLTDVISVAVSEGAQIEGLVAERPDEVLGINDHIQLATMERYYQERSALNLLKSGVGMADPKRVDIRGTVDAGVDCYIDCNVILEGTITLGNRVRIESGVVIKDSRLADDVHIFPNTVIEGAEIAAGCAVGPFARIRPGTELSDGVKIGNFVETKSARVGKNTKASHLAYLGDASIGSGCNIGAGTIFCNYDGVDKHRTELGDGVFVGSNSTLVAPINIGDDAFVGAGSTLSKGVRSSELAIGRGKQRNIAGWLSPAAKAKKEK